MTHKATKKILKRVFATDPDTDKLIDISKRIESGELEEVEAEWGKDFQDYMDSKGRRIKPHTIVGWEDDDGNLFMRKGIFYSSEAWNEDKENWA